MIKNQISINLLAIEDRQIHICRKGGNNYEHIINLMLITESNRKHYIAIKFLGRLLLSQNTKHKGKEYFCMNCLQGFWEEKSRNEHVGYCKGNESVRIEMPHKAPIVEYLDGQFQFKVPFIMYADFESILNRYWGQITIRGSRQLETSMSTFHLDGVFTVTLLVAKLRILWCCIEERIAFESFTIT